MAFWSVSEELHRCMLCQKRSPELMHGLCLLCVDRIVRTWIVKFKMSSNVLDEGIVK